MIRKHLVWKGSREEDIVFLKYYNVWEEVFKLCGIFSESLGV